MRTVRRNFTWAEYTAAAARPPGSNWTHPASRGESPSFTGTADYDTALALLAHGWQEGRERMSTGLAALAPATITTPTRTLDVAGAYPIAALAAGGAMDCMVTPCQIVTPRPAIRIVAGFAAPWTITPNAIMNRGIAIASVIDTLESAGQRVELIAERRGISKKARADYRLTITLKDAEQPLEIDRIAFALAHPSMLRRIAFRIDEQTFTQAAWGPGYGVPQQADAADFPDAILIPSIDSNDAYDTPEKALPTVLQIVRAAGIDIDTD